MAAVATGSSSFRRPTGQSVDPRDVVREVFISQISGDSNPSMPIGQVSLMGLIVDSNSTVDFCREEGLTLAELAEKRWSNKPHVYKIDDGTGVLPVVHFIKWDQKELERASVLEAAIEAEAGEETRRLRGRHQPAIQSKMLARTVQGFRDRLGGFPIGTMVSVTGRHRYQRGELAIMANHVQKVTDPNMEVERIMRLGARESSAKPKRIN